jgi:hypothetical protein
MACLAILTSRSAAGDVLREQVIQLEEGWNAVYLEVEPEKNTPAEVFKDKPIDVVTRYFRLVSPVQFISDPGDEPWKSEGWGVWYAPAREDAFLTSLHAIQGNKTYLIHATADYQWRITGKVRFERRKWRSESYNLVGFTVDPQSPPTFAQFFSGSGSLSGQKIYRLRDDKWALVSSPQSSLMKSGEAFWTYCTGNTDFQGPIDLDGPATGVLDFGDASSLRKLIWKSVGPSAAPISVESVAPAGNVGTALPLRVVLRDLDSLTDSFPPLNSLNLGGDEGALSGKLSLQLRREEMSAPIQSSLLKFSDGAGSIVWIPATASKTPPLETP